eukprot:TRINITY_DN72956_c0_g1_i1.p1 TRINITY_DN72956_c0_g1~~TRINITY_DN72956_c0_g1_i1.p1  ORF type:complete len:245 (+),score=24.63 TRINITY_DN72956_c0_g1_i1:160-894(+)
MGRIHQAPDVQGTRRILHPGTRLCISGLPVGVKKTTLQGVFGEFGDIVRIEVSQDRPVTFIEFEEPCDAREALKMMDGALVDKQRISVRLVVEKHRPTPCHAERVELAYLAHLEARAQQKRGDNVYAVVASERAECVEGIECTGSAWQLTRKVPHCGDSVSSGGDRCNARDRDVDRHAHSSHSRSQRSKRPRQRRVRRGSSRSRDRDRAVVRRGDDRRDSSRGRSERDRHRGQERGRCRVAFRG